QEQTATTTTRPRMHCPGEPSVANIDAAEPAPTRAPASRRAKRIAQRRNPKTELVTAAATVAWRYVAYRRNPATARARYARGMAREVYVVGERRLPISRYARCGRLRLFVKSGAAGKPVCSAGFRMEPWRSPERPASWTFRAI